jgi:hypothetical protein
MPLGYKNRKRIAPGLFVNLSKRGAGVSVGRRGASTSVSSSGRSQLSLGWRGLFWRKRL